MIASSLISSINLYTFRDIPCDVRIERGKQVYDEQVYRFESMQRKWKWHQQNINPFAIQRAIAGNTIC